MLSLIDSFNLSLSPPGPTHYLGHTIGLVLSYGLTLSDLTCSDPCISDHYYKCFDLFLSP